MKTARALAVVALSISMSLVAAVPRVVFAEPATPPATAPASLPIRIKAGLDKPLTDKAGHVWLADTGFVDGEVIERPDVTVTGTDAPELFHSEHYGMTAFSQPLPNGKYTVKLYFAETYEDVKGAGERVFSFNVEGQNVADFDIAKEAGGTLKAVVKTFDVEIKDGKLDIAFTEKVQAPTVNAIEIAARP